MAAGRDRDPLQERIHSKDGHRSAVERRRPTVVPRVADDQDRGDRRLRPDPDILGAHHLVGRGACRARDALD
ncbi:MAG: hypothetical protein ACRDV2_00715, partial [Actinomycetes bacterium]